MLFMSTFSKPMPQKWQIKEEFNRKPVRIQYSIILTLISNHLDSSLVMKINRWHICCAIITLKQSITINHYVQSSYLLLTSYQVSGAGRSGQLPTANQQHVITSTPVYQPTTSNSSGPIRWLHAKLAVSPEQHGFTDYILHCIRYNLFKHELFYRRDHHVM